MATRKPTPENTRFNRKPYVPNGAGNKAIKTARDKYAKHKDKPTTAAADPSLRLPEALMQVDPQMISQVLPQMYSKLMFVRNLMNTFNSMNNNSSGTSPQGYAKTSIVNIFYGALRILVKEHGYNEVLTELFDALSNDRYKNIYELYQEIVFESITKLIIDAEKYGETNIPISPIPPVVYGNTIPSIVLSSYNNVPDFYIQQYYRSDLDPYPGYIEYKNDSDEVVYVKRRNIDYPYESAEIEIFTTAEYNMAEELSPYFDDKNLTVTVLNELLVKYCTKIIEEISEKNNGKNSNKNLLSLLISLAGMAGQMATTTITNHLPQSVLNISSMTKTLQEHQKNIGKIKKLKQYSNLAFIPLQMLNPNVLSLFQSVLKGKKVSPQQIAQFVIQRVNT